MLRALSVLNTLPMRKNFSDLNTQGVCTTRARRCTTRCSTHMASALTAARYAAVISGNRSSQMLRASRNKEKHQQYEYRAQMFEACEALRHALLDCGVGIDGGTVCFSHVVADVEGPNLRVLT